MLEKRTDFSGPLNVCSRTMADIAPEFEELWNDANRLIKPEQLERWKGELDIIRVAHRSMVTTLNKFNQLNKKASEIK